jgi:hypothetical protein
MLPFVLHCATKNPNNMKLNFFLSLLFVLTCVVTSQAQIKKGSLLLGGSVGFNQIKSKGDASAVSTIKTNTVTISPSVGVALKENLVAGVRFNYMKYTQKSNYDVANYLNTDIKNYGGGIFLRGYVPVINRLYVFGEGSATYTDVKQTSIQGYYTSKQERKIKGWNTGLSFTPGISYGVSKKFQIEGGFNSLFSATYAKSKTTYNDNPAGTLESFSAGISQDDESMFYVGFRFIL